MSKTDKLYLSVILDKSMASDLQIVGRCLEVKGYRKKIRPMNQSEVIRVAVTLLANALKTGSLTEIPRLPGVPAVSFIAPWPKGEKIP